MPEPIFLTLEQVLAMHARQISTYGGDPAEPTERGQGLLESALAQPQASWNGQWLNSYPFGMAAAYLYSICQNHPFEDGNKRVAFDAALTFLLLNGYECMASEDDATEFVLQVASGKVPKATVAEWLAQNSQPYSE